MFHQFNKFNSYKMYKNIKMLWDKNVYKISNKRIDKLYNFKPKNILYNNNNINRNQKYYLYHIFINQKNLCFWNAYQNLD